MNNRSLENKITNLFNITSKEHSIFTKLDLKHLSISKNINTDYVNDFFHGSLSELEITININEQQIRSELFKSSNANEFLKIIDDNEIQISKIKRNLLINDFNENKNSIMDYVSTYIQNIKNKFLLLQNTARQISRDKGTWNLYIAKYFLKGITPYKRSGIIAPLILFPVRIEESNRTLYIKKDGENFVINEKLIVFLQRDIEKQKKYIIDYKNIASLEELKKEIEDILEINPIETKFTKTFNFTSETKDSLVSKYPNNLIINDEVVLGIFDPHGGKLSEELNQLIRTNDYQEIFGKDPETTIENIEEDEVYDDPIIQIDKLDIYQRYAVRAALKGDTIIHGPPGTGKSEVISNIIANVLYDNKTILMISEKMAALKVLINRLKDLSIFTISIYDATEKKEFYEQIKKLKGFLNNSWFSNHTFSINNVDKELLESQIDKIKNYKYSIDRMNDFEEYLVNNINFKQLSTEVNKIGGFKVIENFIDENVYSKIQEAKSKNGLDSSKELFEKVNKILSFIKENNLSSWEAFENFKHDSLAFKSILEKYNLSINNELIEDCKKSYQFLSKLVSENQQYYVLLKENPELFYEDIKSFNEIEDNLVGVINDNFFVDIQKSAKKIKSFLNNLKISKDSNKKFLLDNFLKTGIINAEKSFKDKLFYKRKLDDKDNFVLSTFNKMNQLDLDKYKDFNYIKSNYYYLNPIHVLYLFNNKIFDKKYAYFFENKFELIDYDLIGIILKFKLSTERFNKLVELSNIYKIFKEQFPEFISTNLFNYFIEKNKNTKWNIFSDIIKNIVKVNILNKIIALPREDKELINEAFRVANLERRPSILKYLDKFNRALKLIFPIWITRPEQCATYLPFEKGIFDYGIFDEASQMFLERAYPLLYRSNINIVAGDDKQLKPTNFFAARNVESEDDEYEIDDLDTQESLLDRAKATTWIEVILKNHYRSTSRSLIEFSSKYIYDGKLNYATVNGKINDLAVEVKNVGGYFIDKINKLEAEEIINQLEKYHNLYESILVITFNSSQQDYVQNMMYNRKQINNEIIKKFNEGKINVINIENVQGDEADLVILSVCYGKKGVNEKIRAQFGPIIQSGGKNRLNVAITRAKSKMIVVKSLSAKDISESANDNLMTFKHFLAFVDSIHEKQTKERDVDKKFDKVNQHFDSSFEEDVYDSIKMLIDNYGLKLLTQYEVGNKKIDIVVTSTDESKVYLGIEVDGWQYHRGTKKKLEDYERQLFLEARGYKIFRVLEHEWDYNKDVVINSLFIELKEQLSKSDNINN